MNMNYSETEWFEKLRTTVRCRAEVDEAAGWFARLESVNYESLVRSLIDAGEDRPLGILLNICSINRVRLDPGLLAEAIKVVEPLTDLALPYRDQDECAIEPLLRAAESEDISWDRQAYAGRLAAELTIRFGCDPKPVELFLNRLRSRTYSLDANLIVQDTFRLLEKKGENIAEFPWQTLRDALSSLPEERPPVVIGGGFSVRRPVPKLGRNAPCHCGSGKKYKKCCYEKDQDLLRDASPYEGVTMTQVRATPGLIDDKEIIEDMRAYELKKLDPPALGPRQLLAASRRCDRFGLREKALEMLLALRDRVPEEEFDFGHLEDLLNSALDAGDLTLASRIREHIPEEEIFHPEGIRIRFDILEGREKFKLLEEHCRTSLVDADGSDKLDEPLIDLSHTFERTFPALSIIFSRAAISGKHGNVFDWEVLLDVVRSARGSLGLDPWSDPVEDYFYRLEDELLSEGEEDAKAREIDSLRSQVRESRRAAAEKESELRKRESELSGLMKRLESVERSDSKKNDDAGPASEASAAEKETVQRLRQQIEGLKAEVRSQQQERLDLRNQLKKVKKEASSREYGRGPQPGGTETESHRDEAISAPHASKRVLLPEFTAAFRRSCDGIPLPIAAKALRAAAGFGAGDVQILRQTKRIERIPDLLRIRIDLRYRLLVRPHAAADRLEVLELLPRADLEKYIKQHAQ